MGAHAVLKGKGYYYSFKQEGSICRSRENIVESELSRLLSAVKKMSKGLSHHTLIPNHVWHSKHDGAGRGD